MGDGSYSLNFFGFFFQNFEVYFFGFPAVFLVPFGFRKVREAGSFHVSNFRPDPTTGVRVMTQKPKKLTSIKLTGIKF